MDYLHISDKPKYLHSLRECTIKELSKFYTKLLKKVTSVGSTTKNDLYKKLQDSLKKEPVKIQHSSEVSKINDYGKKQSRLLIITQYGLFNVKKNRFVIKRFIPLFQITDISLSVAIPKNIESPETELVVHVEHSYDYHYCSSHSIEICEIIATSPINQILNAFIEAANNLQKGTGQNFITIRKVKKRDLSDFAVTKSELKKILKSTDSRRTSSLEGLGIFMGAYKSAGSTKNPLQGSLSTSPNLPPDDLSDSNYLNRASEGQQDMFQLLNQMGETSIDVDGPPSDQTEAKEKSLSQRFGNQPLAKIGNLKDLILNAKKKLRKPEAEEESTDSEEILKQDKQKEIEKNIDGYLEGQNASIDAEKFRESVYKCSENMSEDESVEYSD